MTGGANERLELPVGDRRPVDPEGIDGNAMDGRFFGIVLVRSHAKCAAGNEHHAGMAIVCCRGISLHRLVGLQHRELRLSRTAVAGATLSRYPQWRKCSPRCDVTSSAFRRIMLAAPGALTCEGSRHADRLENATRHGCRTKLDLGPTECREVVLAGEILLQERQCPSNALIRKDDRRRAARRTRQQANRRF